MADADIGLIGLAVMGQNLVLNMNDHGFKVSVFNRTVSKVDDFLLGPAKGTNVQGTHSLKQLVTSLKKPRRVMLMVKAGAAVDEFIEQLIPLLEPGDIIIDGGNSLYTDSNRRYQKLQSQRLRFIGAGISGGEEGARHGPSIMPGGDPEAWPHVKTIFQAIAAKVEGMPCCEWVGDQGAGHYVKMIHNGIEYGDMQIICEAYHLLKDALKLNADEQQAIFAEWNRTELNSFLIEITSNILGYKDQDGQPMVDKILDVAGQKGTGKWTVENALDLGIPLTLIGEAVFARVLSSLKEDRLKANRVLKGPITSFIPRTDAWINHIRNALYASKIVSYAQGFMLMREAANHYGWKLNFGSIALMWRGGCIIRSSFLGKIKEAYDTNPELKSLLMDDYFSKEINQVEESWRESVALGAKAGIPLPCFSSALSFYDGYRTERLPANLLQAQRDYFGAHTYERVDKPRGQFFHTDWSGTGGKVSAGSYNA
jgi:6-phosphogluconate dehydrogenase